jgi:hypothetical protein
MNKKNYTVKDAQRDAIEQFAKPSWRKTADVFAAESERRLNQRENDAIDIVIITGLGVRDFINCLFGLRE